MNNNEENRKDLRRLRNRVDRERLKYEKLIYVNVVIPSELYVVLLEIMDDYLVKKEESLGYC